uniref:Peptidase S8/S53 domain-containing protein n=1 Tax=Romanomermis culicivorax TaxID=13658 RepID=A0A915KCB2_ROMCU
MEPKQILQNFVSYRQLLEFFSTGVYHGRNGKGSIFVWASGNGGRNGDNCNCDGYANNIYTLAVSAATENDNIPDYSEVCTASLATAYSSGTCDEGGIVTTDIGHKCITGHNATSAAAPIAAAIIALALEANPLLTWRDVQHIVVRTARPAGLNDPDWRRNGAGRSYSNWFGFGLMDAQAMVELARQWEGSSMLGYCMVHSELLDV